MVGGVSHVLSIQRRARPNTRARAHAHTHTLSRARAQEHTHTDGYSSCAAFGVDDTAP